MTTTIGDRRRFRAVLPALVLLLLLLLAAGCSPAEAPLSMGTRAHASVADVDEIVVSLGDGPQELATRNPSLAPAISDSLPLRMSADLDSTWVRYRDRSLDVRVCGSLLTVDGESEPEFSGRADHVFVVLCDSFIDDHRRAIDAAEALAADFARQQSGVRRLDDWLLVADDVAFERFTGLDADYRDFGAVLPYTRDEATALFDQLAAEVRASRGSDPSIFSDQTLLAVFEGDESVVWIKVGSSKAFGGEPLTPEQRIATEYIVSIQFQRKPYVGSLLEPPVRWVGLQEG
jgi:hypothetical protein